MVSVGRISKALAVYEAFQRISEWREDIRTGNPFDLIEQEDMGHLHSDFGSQKIFSVRVVATSKFNVDAF
jgi:hypothetical protein